MQHSFHVEAEFIATLFGLVLLKLLHCELVVSLLYCSDTYVLSLGQAYCETGFTLRVCHTLQHLQQLMHVQA